MYWIVIENTSSNVQNILNVTEEGYEKLYLILYELDMPINRIATQVSGLHDALERKEWIKFFNWLSAIPYAKHHGAKSELLLSGSCQWLFAKPVFLDWKRSSASSILWLHGIPGSGKSMLTCSVIKRFQEMYKSPDSSLLFAYFYCSWDTAEPTCADPDHVLRSILMELSSSDMDAPIRQPAVLAYRERLREARGGRPEDLTLKECTTAIVKILEDSPAIIVIEALDECDAVRRQDLILALRQIIRESPSVVKIFLSSRDDRDIVTKMRTASEVYIKAKDNSVDIKNFVVSQVEKAIEEERILNGKVSESLKADIIDTLINKANGM